MPGKSDADAAQIEAMEEAGIEGEASLQPLGSYDFIKLFDDGTTKPSQAIVFPLRVTRQRKKWNEMHERRRRWVRASKAAELVHEPDLARLLRSLAAGPIPQL